MRTRSLENLTREGDSRDADQLKGKWIQFKGELKQRYGKLTRRQKTMELILPIAFGTNLWNQLGLFLKTVSIFSKMRPLSINAKKPCKMSCLQGFWAFILRGSLSSDIRRKAYYTSG